LLPKRQIYILIIAKFRLKNVHFIETKSYNLFCCQYSRNLNQNIPFWGESISKVIALTPGSVRLEAQCLAEFSRGRTVEFLTAKVFDARNKHLTSVNNFNKRA
jgi:hypothetical protein